jgi:hypothetical protein
MVVNAMELTRTQERVRLDGRQCFFSFAWNGFYLGSPCSTALILAKDLSQHSDPLPTSPNTLLAFAAFVQMRLLFRPAKAAHCEFFNDIIAQYEAHGESPLLEWPLASINLKVII